MPATVSPVATDRRIANINADVAGAVEALASANAHGTVAFDLDVNVTHSYVDVAFTIMYEGHSAGIRAFHHDTSVSHVDVNVAFFCPVSSQMPSRYLPPSSLLPMW